MVVTVVMVPLLVLMVRALLLVGRRYRLDMDARDIGITVRGSTVVILRPSVSRIGVDPTKGSLAVRLAPDAVRPPTRLPSPVWDRRRDLLYLCRLDRMDADPSEIVAAARRHAGDRWSGDVISAQKDERRLSRRAVRRECRTTASWHPGVISGRSRTGARRSG